MAFAVEYKSISNFSGVFSRIRGAKGRGVHEMRSVTNVALESAREEGARHRHLPPLAGAGGRTLGSDSPDHGAMQGTPRPRHDRAMRNEGRQRITVATKGFPAEWPQPAAAAARSAESHLSHSIPVNPGASRLSHLIPPRPGESRLSHLIPLHPGESHLSHFVPVNPGESQLIPHAIVLARLTARLRAVLRCLAGAPPPWR